MRTLQFVHIDIQIMADPAQQPHNLIEVTNLFKSFQVGVQTVEVLKDISVTIPYGDFSLILGPSGCGKSTLLHVLLGLEPPTKGVVKFLDIDIYKSGDDDVRSDFRKKHIGMVYQQPNWIKALTVLENVSFPLLLLGVDKPRAMAKAYEKIKQVKMDEWANYRPTELSGGQQQRVALARALINNPEIIIADEPTGNLDFASGEMIMQLFDDLNKTTGKTVIMVTHDLEYLKYAKSVIRMRDGTITGTFDETNKDKVYEDIKLKKQA
jgi:putative ABC transport system ATP-binding protein